MTGRDEWNSHAIFSATLRDFSSCCSIASPKTFFPTRFLLFFFKGPRAQVWRVHIFPWAGFFFSLAKVAWKPSSTYYRRLPVNVHYMYIPNILISLPLFPGCPVFFIFYLYFSHVQWETRLSRCRLSVTIVSDSGNGVVLVPVKNQSVHTYRRRVLSVAWRSGRRRVLVCWPN